MPKKRGKPSFIKVLIVDDELDSPQVVNVIGALESAECNVDVAGDLFTAHRLMVESELEAKKYDYIVLDLRGREKHEMEFASVLDYIGPKRKDEPPEVLVMSAFLGDCSRELRDTLEQQCEGFYSKGQDDLKRLIGHITGVRVIPESSWRHIRGVFVKWLKR